MQHFVSMAVGDSLEDLEQVRLHRHPARARARGKVGTLCRQSVNEVTQQSQELTLTSLVSDEM